MHVDKYRIIKETVGVTGRRICKKKKKSSIANRRTIILLLRKFYKNKLAFCPDDTRITETSPDWGPRQRRGSTRINIIIVTIQRAIHPPVKSRALCLALKYNQYTNSYNLTLGRRGAFSPGNHWVLFVSPPASGCIRAIWGRNFDTWHTVLKQDPAFLSANATVSVYFKNSERIHTIFSILKD